MMRSGNVFPEKRTTSPVFKVEGSNTPKFSLGLFEKKKPKTKNKRKARRRNATRHKSFSIIFCLCNFYRQVMSGGYLPLLGSETQEPLPYLDEKATYSRNYTGSMPSMYETDYTKTYVPTNSSDIFGYSKPIGETIIGNMYEPEENSFLENDVGAQTPVDDSVSRHYGMTRQIKENFEFEGDQGAEITEINPENVNITVQEVPQKQKIIFRPVVVFMLFVAAWFVSSLWVEIAGRALDKWFYNTRVKTLSLMVIVAVVFTVLLALSAYWTGIPFITLEQA
ncbi:hypothetical protein [Brazilian marseillevirus]|uniref:hypothetical protein n=1 Tax=Brazilian marseillevirus TaxID=1813599 RepID=UPI0007838CA6|nr:hypothetical protein A3303_gp433 [Brazilian marseillevirus]AMQ10941.1 hypothetical protein [Brazilian marseillevirus]